MWLNLSMESTPLWLHHKIDKNKCTAACGVVVMVQPRSRNKNHLVRPSGDAGSNITTLINERTVELSAHSRYLKIVGRQATAKRNEKSKIKETFFKTKNSRLSIQNSPTLWRREWRRMATCIIMQLQIRAGTDHRRGKPTALLIQLRFIQQKNTQNPKKSQRISGDLMPNSRNCNAARDYRCPITLPRHPNLQLRAPTNFFLLLLLLLLLSISFLSPNFWLFSPLFQQNFIIAACQTPPSLCPLLAARAGRPFYPIRAKRKSAVNYGTQREPAVTHSTP